MQPRGGGCDACATHSIRHCLAGDIGRRARFALHGWLVGAPFAVGATPQIDAQFSLQYCVARALMNGRLGIPEISPTAARDPALTALLGRIAIEVNSDNAGRYSPVEMVVQLDDGRTLRRFADDFPGNLTRPLDAGQLAAKFHHCLDVAGSPRDRAGALLDCMLHLENGDAAGLAQHIGESVGTPR